ncbi:MAG: protein kinase [Alphaproteobacteria bacterium]|nr:protein kinase [Alphaproteobacteria bacterium]
MLRPGEVIGTYEVVQRIGGGSSAEVFEVVHVTLKTRHALKVLQSQWLENAELRGRFLAEGKLQAGFRSPHLVRVTDTLAEPGVAALVMDLLTGETLRDRLERQGRVPWETAVRWAMEALTGLEVAHAAGVVHRDVKPENLFLDRSEGEERVRVIDFGIAKGADHRTTQAGTLGTCAYMSPEQVKDAGEVDARTDVFAVGAVLWEMLAGHPAFEGRTAFASMQAVLDDDPGLPSALAPDVPAWLDAAVARALSKERGTRWPTARAFREALESRDVTMPAPAKKALPADAPAAPAAPPARRGVGFYLLLVLAGLFGIGAVGATTLATLAWIYRPPVVHDLTITSDPCGRTTVDADIYARAHDVVFTVDGREVHVEADHHGRSHSVATTDLPPGSEVEIEVRAGSSRRTVTHRVEGTPTQLVLELPSDAREGSIGPVRARLEGSCLPTGLVYAAAIGGRTSEGPVSAGSSVALDASGLKTGRHAIEVRILRGDEVVTMAHGTLFVGERPPPNDQDMDGYERPADCNDLDPMVNPGVQELAFPNGVDDDCDGKIDEGTVAYDDDGDGLAERDGDCNDADPGVRPGATELPDCRDQDCDGEIDEGLTLPQKDDRYEPNGDKASAHDLGTDGARSFSRDLDLVFTGTDDESWFTFYSDDGGWDAWGIDVTAVRLPQDSTLLFEVLDDAGFRRGSLTVDSEGEKLLVTGRGFRDDSGHYRLRVVPSKLVRPWCPAVVRLEAR